MKSCRHLFSTFAVLAIFGSACSDGNSEGGGAGGAGSSGNSNGGSRASSASGGSSSAQGGSSSAQGGSSSARGGSSSSSASSSAAGSGGSTTTTGGKTGTGGTTSQTGSVTGGSTSTGGGTGGKTGTGGTTSSGGATGGTSGGGTTGSGGSTSTGDTCTPGSCPPGNAPVKSAGCGKALGTLKTGQQHITSGGKNREYTIDIPSDYDPSHPYRLFFTFHWIGASDQVLVSGLVENINGQGSGGGAENYAYYGLKRQATLAKEPAIFIAPSSDGQMWDYSTDGVLFEGLLKTASENLCIDTSRVFATGFSFGAMMSYALSITHQKQLRAVVGMAAANYNLPSEPTDSGGQIAYMGTTGMSDGTCPYVQSDGEKKGGKYCALAHAQDNGCTIPANLPTTTKGSKTHVCYDFEGCKAGYPVKMCTFDGTHQCGVADGGTVNNGLTSWIPTESWKFFSQF